MDEEEPNGEAESAMFQVVSRATGFQRVDADATLVDGNEYTVDLSFLRRTGDPSGVIWPSEYTQPSTVRIKRGVEEQVAVRLSFASANDLALNIILEISEKGGVDFESLEKNFEIIRQRLREIESDGE